MYSKGPGQNDAKWDANRIHGGVHEERIHGMEEH